MSTACRAECYSDTVQWRGEGAQLLDSLVLFFVNSFASQESGCYILEAWMRNKFVMRAIGNQELVLGKRHQEVIG